MTKATKRWLIEQAVATVVIIVGAFFGWAVCVVGLNILGVL